ncbi:MAG: septal ring lytic transglycosylase RlpA family protein [Spirulina sp.]
MKQSVLGGLTAAVILSTFGAPLPSHAQSTGDSRQSSESELDFLLASAASVLPETATTALTADPSSAEAETSDEANLVTSNPRQPISDDLVAVFPHALDANQAATVYLRSIPVITLIGDELATLGESKETPNAPTEADPDPVDRANEIVDRLLALAETEDPADIEARWLADQQAFVVAWEDEVLLTVNRQTILPDTTENPAEDVLHIANRMRRLLGDAPALSRVEGMPEPVRPAAPQVGVVTSTLTGTASWYGPGFHGRRSASGEVFNQNDLTAAHRTLPFGTRVRVTNLRTGQQVIVRINDRGPFSRGRIIDLSAAAAGQIGLRASGVGQVQVEVLSNP